LIRRSFLKIEPPYLKISQVVMARMCWATVIPQDELVGRKK
jgi:hypothetical protein